MTGGRASVTAGRASVTGGRAVASGGVARVTGGRSRVTGGRASAMGGPTCVTGGSGRWEHRKNEGLIYYGMREHRKIRTFFTVGGGNTVKTRNYIWQEAGTP